MDTEKEMRDYEWLEILDSLVIGPYQEVASRLSNSYLAVYFSFYQNL